MTILLLIRHGENDYLKKGILVGTTPGITFKRARPPAGCRALRVLGVPAHPGSVCQPADTGSRNRLPTGGDPGLRDRLRPALADIDVGQWTGKKLSQLKKLAAWSQVQQRPSDIFVFPEGIPFRNSSNGIPTKWYCSHPGTGKMICWQFSFILTPSSWSLAAS